MEIKFNKIEQKGNSLIIDTNDNEMFMKIIKKRYKNELEKTYFSFDSIDDNNVIVINTNGINKSELFERAYQLGSMIKSINFHLKKGVDISIFI